MRFAKIKKKSKKSDKDRRCYWCKLYGTNKCLNKELAKTDSVCENFKWCSTLKSI